MAALRHGERNLGTDSVRRGVVKPPGIVAAW
jgi:hypothetical protein